MGCLVGLLMSENMGIDSKTKSLPVVEIKLWVNV